MISIFRLRLFEEGQRIFDAVLSLAAEPLTARSARRAILAYPFMTIKVAAGFIGRPCALFLKGVSLHAHPKRTH
jgi:DUF1365 family protein